MTKPSYSNPKFNLWSETWINLERSSGPPVLVSIEQALLEAHCFIAICNPSPLVVVGIHRLLVAIMQASLDPQKEADLRRVWQNGCFPVESIKAFGEIYSNRFDLFSTEMPFLQSGDLPLCPEKGDNSKTVAYLAAETSPASALDHYRHPFTSGEYFCPTCAASTLLTIPPFVSIGGRGYRPSINGIPPLYVLPVGNNLFQSLILSLLWPKETYWPNAASRQNDWPWWKHSPTIERGKEVIEVGYLHSLTFPARQIRLHPVKKNSLCTRCGQVSEWGVSTMIFEMGESRPKDSSPWMDPFVAYRLPDEGKTGNPFAIRPDSNKALWREFSGLFLSPGRDAKKRVQRPSILSHIAEQEYGEDQPEIHFRCIGVRMDQAKVLEWVDASFKVPAKVMNDIDVTYKVKQATQFADDCGGVMAGAFRSAVNTSRLGDRHKRLKDQMLRQYWATLANPFRYFILSLVEPENRSMAIEQWANTVARQAQAAFNANITQIGEDAASLRQQTQGMQDCHSKLEKKVKKYLEQGVII